MTPNSIHRFLSAALLLCSAAFFSHVRTGQATSLAPGSDRMETLQESIRRINAKIGPTVVHIEAVLKVDNASMASTGSGIVTDTNGHILTNHHVVDKAEKVTVTISGQKRKIPAEIVGLDPQTDLAVLRIPKSFTTEAAPFGNSSAMQVGDWVLAIGNPYGLDGTVSFGIISAVQRNLSYAGVLNDFLQTDAMIDFGSSGGPLVNMKGEVIGINSRGQGRGIGFTIPSNTALEVRNKLIQQGQVERAWLGVTIQPLDRDLAESLGVPKATGVVINQVHGSSSAERAGLQAGDILVGFDGQKLEAEDEQQIRSVTRLVAQTPVGRKVPLEIIRGGKSVTLQAEMLRQPKLEGEAEESPFGFHIKEITRPLMIQERLTTGNGVYVSFVETGSVADEANLARGDVIQRIGKVKIDGLKDFQRMNSKLAKEKRILLTVIRANELRYVLLKNDRRRPLSERSLPEDSSK